MHMEKQELLYQVRKAQRNATNKISRLRRNGVEIGRTDEDVRRDPRKVKNYNRRQLAKYLQELESFNSRRTRFEANLPEFNPRKWAEYKRLENEYNKLADREKNKVGRIKLPGQDTTLKARMEEMRKQTLRAGGERVRFEGIHRRAEDIPSERALDRLIADMRNRVDPTYQDKQLVNQRRNARRLLRDSEGVRPGEFKRLRGLSDRQFNLLWNYTNYATLVASRYRSTSPGQSAREEGSTVEDASSDIDALLEWAESLRKR